MTHWPTIEKVYVNFGYTPTKCTCWSSRKITSKPILWFHFWIIWNVICINKNYYCTFYQYTLSNTIYQILFIKYHLSNTFYQIPFIIYQIMFIKYCWSNTICCQIFFNESMNQSMNESINREFLERHICR